MLKSTCRRIRPSFYPRTWHLVRTFAEEKKPVQDAKELTEKTAQGQPKRREWDDFEDFFSPRMWNAPVSRIFDHLNRNFFRDDDIWRGPFAKGLSREAANWKPRTDVHETKDAFNITAELPGVPKDNVKVFYLHIIRLQGRWKLMKIETH